MSLSSTPPFEAVSSKTLSMFSICFTFPPHTLCVLILLRELRDAIFIPDEDDKSRIDAWGATQDPPQKYAILRNTSPQWIREHCKHIIPAPNRLHHLVSRVFRTYGPLVDPKTNKPLFTLDNWKTAKHVLDLIRNGYLSDPPGIPLYTVVGLDKKAGGLPMYRCSRGLMQQREVSTSIFENVSQSVVHQFAMSMQYYMILFFITTLRYAFQIHIHYS